MSNPFKTYTTEGLAIGDRVTLANKEGDTVTFTVAQVQDPRTLVNSSGTKFDLHGWFVQGVEFTLPETDGLYVSYSASVPVVIQRIQGAWFASDGKEGIEESDLLNYMPVFRLVTVNTTVSTFISKLKEHRQVKYDRTPAADVYKNAMQAVADDMRER